MAASISAHKNKSTNIPVKPSLSEIEAANLLIQLSSEGSEGDRRHYNCSSNNNSCSYSVVQGSGDASSSSSSSTSIAAAAEIEDEGFARKKKRYRSIEGLYRVTTPLSAKTMKRRK